VVVASTELATKNDVVLMLKGSAYGLRYRRPDQLRGHLRTSCRRIRDEVAVGGEVELLDGRWYPICDGECPCRAHVRGDEHLGVDSPEWFASEAG